MPRKIVLLFLFLLFFVRQPSGCAEQWNEESARQAAFQNISKIIDVSPYAGKDPNFGENQSVLQRGGGEVANRFVTANPEPPISYVVSLLDMNGVPTMTTFYDREGFALTVRLFSSEKYPRRGLIYCVTDFSDTDGKKHKAGELLSIHFQISSAEAYYFEPEGKCTYHAQF